MLLVGVAAAVLVKQAEAVGREQTRGQLLDTTRALSLVVDRQLDGYAQLLRSLAASEAMQRGDFAALDRQARAALQDEDAWITLADRRGNQLVNTLLPAGAALPKGELPPAVWAELDTGRPRVCNLANGMAERRILCVDLPVMQGGRAAYKLSVIFRPRLLQRIIEAQRVPAERYATILDREGVVVWRNAAPERYVGRPATADMLRAMRAGREGVIRSRSLDGAETEAAFSRSETSGWSFIVAIPEAELAAGARAALKDGAIIAALLLLAALATALVALRRINADIRNLAEAGRQIREGGPPAFAGSRFEEFAALGTVLRDAIAERDDSREWFAHAQEVGGIGSWKWNIRRDEGRVSDAYKRMHGLEEVEGPLKFRQLLSVVHPEDRRGYRRWLKHARLRLEASDHAYRVVRRDGSVCRVLARGRPIFSEDGRLVAAVGIVRDVTAEWEAEDALRRLNEALEAKVEARTLERDRLWNLARDPFVVADDAGVWLAASPAWSTLLGYPLEDFIGRTSEWIEHPDDIARTRAEDQRLAAGRVTERFENRFRAKDGSYRWLSWTAVPENGRFYSVARDITAEKEQAEALRKTELALREAQKMESIGQITGGVAHDFNNLLTPILGTLDILQQRGLPDARSERMVANAVEAAERARMLVQRLLAFARRQPLRAAPLDLAATLNQMRPLLETSVGPQVRLQVAEGEDLPPILADSQQFELALLNLAVNARDAMPNGGALTIEAEAVAFTEDGPGRPPAGRYVEVRVSDTGVGMPETVIARAIEPFFSTKGLGRGTGLGLSMVHGLMAQLGGGMHISSALGEGTTVTLWLPVTAAPAVPENEPAAPRPRVATAGRVLLVDDEVMPRSSVAQMLSEAGFEVLEAASAKEALSRLEAETFDLLVTDHLMPGMSGAELARTARERWPNLRLLIISGYADVDDIAPDLPRLSKPFRQAELQAALAFDASLEPAE
jgi:PAS domain S-box-containing protein